MPKKLPKFSLYQQEEQNLSQAMVIHLNKTLRCLSQALPCLDLIYQQCSEVWQGKRSLSSLMYGFISINACDLNPSQEEIKIRLSLLALYQTLTQNALHSFGKNSLETQGCQDILFNALSLFQWSTPIMEQLVKHLYWLSSFF